MEHELFPWLPFMFEKIFIRLLKGKPWLVDYDDASYVKYQQICFMENKILRVMAAADIVTVGNPVLRDFAARFNQRVELVPTVVDLNRYTRMADFHEDRFFIGWIGGPQNVRHLKLIAPALQEVAQKHAISLKCVGAPPTFSLPGVPVEVVPWAWETELEHLLSFDVGISPLDTDPFSQGKSGFKLIQYMACGLPVVASPVGANKNIVDHGINGFLASDNREWTEYLGVFRDKKNLRISMGTKGREKVQRVFSLQAVLPKLINIFDYALSSEKVMVEELR